MDVIGKRPKTEESRYFYRDVWSWSRLADYCIAVAPKVCANCRSWHSNEGAGLNAKDARRLADALQTEIDSGRCAAFVEESTRKVLECGWWLLPYFPFPFKPKAVQEFADFLPDSGGFKIC